MKFAAKKSGFSVLSIAVLLLIAGSASVRDAHAQATPSCTQACFLRTNYGQIGRPQLNFVAGDSADNRIYIQPNGDRPNAKWDFIPVQGEPGFFYICDTKHKLCMVAGDAYMDGNVYHQAPNNRDNAKWRVTDPSVGTIYNKKYPNAAIYYDAEWDGYLHMRVVDATHKPNVISILPSVAAAALSLPSGKFVLVDAKHGHPIFANNPYMQNIRVNHGTLLPVEGPNAPRKYAQLIFEAPDKIRLATPTSKWYLAPGKVPDGRVYWVQDVKDTTPWTMKFDGCPGGYFQLIDSRNGMVLLAGDEYDGQTYEQGFNNRLNGCWAAKTAAEYNDAASMVKLKQYQHPGAVGQFGDGSTDSLPNAVNSGPIYWEWSSGSPGLGIDVSSECSVGGVGAFGVNVPCTKWKRKCWRAVNLSTMPVIVESSRSADSSYVSTMTGWMVVPPQSQRDFQSIGGGHYATCARCGTANYQNKWTTPAGASMHQVWNWDVNDRTGKNVGKIWIGAWDDDTSGCPNPLNLE